MTDTAHATAHDPDMKVKAYFTVFIALAVFTAVSFVANWAAHPEHAWITPFTSFVIILGVAIIKAVLVALIFMHLKFDWSKLYFLIITALIMGTMMMTVLMPDIVIAWQHSQHPLAQPVSTTGTR
jgi:caa(3)-type oxidase subunit IV